MEHKCGRPLGLQINEKSGDIYIADAYYGLMVVGPNGGMAQQLASSAEGVPFRFTNGLDIDQENGDIYFTDTSSRYDRSEYEMAMLSGDATGRLMKYDPRTKQVSVLMRGLAFSNGVALSQDKSYLLVTETTLFRIHKYWLTGTKKGTSEILMLLPGTPDNITKTTNGEFLVAVNSPTARALAMRIDGEGRIIEVLDVTFISQTISEVHEHDRRLFLGSVTVDHVGVF
ncbi:Strictosidine synthase 1 [Acorus gramineus]|uniref:Strictosidine synthase 1 n=1 Tax=Acorus gramineus TaxID=55184 RepID=A0AAV9BCG6_ACOGR|nr:Strictosidine synthase 1 [Acorus gramineus]